MDIRQRAKIGLSERFNQVEHGANIDTCSLGARYTSVQEIGNPFCEKPFTGARVLIGKVPYLFDYKPSDFYTN